MDLKPQTVPVTDAEPISEFDDDSSVGRLAKGAGISILGVGIGRGLDFVKQIAMARLLGPELFGLYAIGWNFLRIVGVLAPLGLHSGVIHFATSFWRKDAGALKSIITRSVAISFLFGALFSLILWILAPWITTELFKEPEYLSLFRVFLLMLPFASGLRVAASATRISQRMQYSVMTEEIAQSTLNLALFVIFYLLGWQLFGAILSTVISFFAALLLAIYYIRQLFPQARVAAGKRVISNRELLSFSLPASVAGLLGVVIGRVDRLFLGYYWPASDVGIYQAAAQISIIMALVLNAFNMILTPMISEQYQKGNLKHLEELFRINTKWGIYCVVPVVLVIAFAGEDVMQVLFGVEYLSGATALRILTIGQFVNIATGATGLMLVMTGNQTVWFRISIVIVVVNLMLNYILIPAWGMNGAALATATTVGGLFLIGLLFVKRIVGIWPYDRRYFKGVAAASASTILLAIIHAFDLPALPKLLLMATTASVSFFLALYFLGLDDEDFELLSLATNRIRSK